MAACWADLDENLRACVLLHLDYPDLVHVGCTSRGMAREAESDVVWATRYLRHFGTDFWGEDAPPHPYHGVPAVGENEWVTRCGAIDTFGTFMGEAVREEEQSAGRRASEEHARGVRSGLVAFAREHGRSGYGGWKLAFKRMHEMVSVWQTECRLAFLISGHTSFERLSSIADIIKKAALSDRFGSDRLRGSEKPNNTAVMDVLSPSGECRVIRLGMRHEESWIEDSTPFDPTNFCVLRRPRNWWGDDPLNENQFDEGDSMGAEQDEQLIGGLFRNLGLIRHRWFGVRLMVVFALDCERMEGEGADAEAYRESAFRELHGLLGEGKGQFRQGLCLNLYLINPTSVTNVDAIRERIKVPLMNQPQHWCPFYGGPVIFVVTAFTMPPIRTIQPPDEHQEVEESESESESDRVARETAIESAFSWLAKQPSIRPNFSYPHTDTAWLCALADDRSRASSGH